MTDNKNRTGWFRSYGGSVLHYWRPWDANTYFSRPLCVPSQTFPGYCLQDDPSKRPCKRCFKRAGEKLLAKLTTIQRKAVTDHDSHKNV